MTIKPGESLKRHITPVDVFFHVLEGEGIIEIGEEKEISWKKYTYRKPRKNCPLLYNERDEDLPIIVIKVPDQ